MEYLLRFVIGGAIITGVSFLASRAQGTWAGLLSSIPIMGTVSLVLFYLSGTRDSTHEYIRTMLILTPTALAWLVPLYLALPLGFWWALTIASVSAVIVGFILWLIIT